MTDQDAVQRCLAGDKDAFAEIVRQYQAQILAYCLRMLGNREDAADAAQQAFVQAYRHLNRYDPHQPFRPWLYRIATNLCIDFRRRSGRQASPMADEDLERISEPTASPAHLADLAADREEIREAVARLPDHFRTVILLHYFEDLSYQEIAHQTKLPMGTISTHLYRAKQHLKRTLTERGMAGDGTYPARSASAVPGR